MTTAWEHPAVMAPLRFPERSNASVTRLPVNGAGRIENQRTVIARQGRHPEPERAGILYACPAEAV